MMLVIGIQNGFEGCVAKKSIKSGRNDVAKKTIQSQGNGVCWVKADDSGRLCINYEGRQIWEHCLLFLWRWEEIGMLHE